LLDFLQGSEVDKNKLGFYFSIFLGVALVSFFTYDIIITNILSYYYCESTPTHPKTLITKKIEYPESIYWEDNIYPGFSKED